LIAYINTIKKINRSTALQMCQLFLSFCFCLNCRGRRSWRMRMDLRHCWMMSRLVRRQQRYSHAHRRPQETTLFISWLQTMWEHAVMISCLWRW